MTTSSEAINTHAPTRECVAAVDRALASHPDFADTRRIQGRVRARYEFGIDILSDHLPGVAQARPVLLGNGTHDPGGRGDLLRDPVLQMALEAALWRLERDELRSPDDLEEVVALVRPRLADLGGRLPSESEQRDPHRAGPDRQIWLPGLTGQPGPLQGRLHQAMIEQFLDGNQVDGELLAVDARTVELVDRASDLLTTMLPGVGDVLRHVTVLALMRGSSVEGRHMSAAGGDLVPGIVVIDPGELEDSWEAASTLLHEALHLRLFDISRAFALIAEPSATVEIPWRRVTWDLPRVLFAFHVYVHLVLYQAGTTVAAETLSGRFGALATNVGVTRGTDAEYSGAEARTRYLGEQLTGPLWPRLTREGQRLVRWLIDTAAPLTHRPVATLPDRDPTHDRDANPKGDLPHAHRGPDAPAGPYSRVDGLRTRPLPDLACCFVYHPANRRLHCLNLNAWTVLELCDGRADLADAYRDLVASKLTPAQAAHHLRLALTRLTDMGLIRADG